MKTMALLITCTISGCAQYTAVQMNLIEQARKGVVLTRESLAGKSQIIDKFQEQQRARLDDAFDADVREQSTLTSDWVIEQRRAYSAALNAMITQQQATRDARIADEKNLTAIDDALSQVLLLQSIQLRLANSFQEIKP